MNFLTLLGGRSDKKVRSFDKEIVETLKIRCETGWF